MTRMGTDVEREEKYKDRREDETLEFKSAACLEKDDLRPISKAVCGLLNARGGEVIIGIGEGPRGQVLEDITDVEAARRRVVDHLVSCLSPALPIELLVETHADEHGGWLRIDVPNQPGLYAVRGRSGKLQVFRRTNDVTAPLRWTDVLHELEEPERPAEDGDRTMIESWVGETVPPAWRPPTDGALLFCIRLKAKGSEATRRVVGAAFLKDRVSAWIRDPTQLGIRQLGWHFGSGYGSFDPIPKTKGEWYGTGGEGGFRRLELSTSGALNFGTELEGLEHHSSSGEHRLLDPLAIIETLASCATLIEAVHEGVGARGAVSAELQLRGVQGWQLPPEAPTRLADPLRIDWQDPYPYPDTSLLTATMEATEFEQRPNRLVWILIQQLYLDFGYSGEHLPFWDAERGRFIFPT